MFRGIHSATLDAKGRMALPARFRDVLTADHDGRLVFTIDIVERCLLLYPLPAWEGVQERLEALGNVSARNRNLQRMLIGHATDAELDGNGRVLVPPMLRSFAKLEKKLVCVGQGKKVELWDEQSWHGRMDSWMADESLRAFEDSDGVAELSL